MGQDSYQKIAVIGGGVAGIVSAYLLSRKHQVTLFEANDYLGGHTNTITIDKGPDRGARIDTGFIVCNDQTYPNFLKFLKQLHVDVQPSDMSFGYHCDITGMSYSGNGLNGFFAQRSHLLNPSFIKMIFDFLKFNRKIKKELQEGSLKGLSLKDYFKKNSYSKTFKETYLYPMGAAIWSASFDQIENFPIEMFARFFQNHGLLTVSGHPQWLTVQHGSASYVEAFQKTFPGSIFLNSAVQSIKRSESQVYLKTKEKEHSYDAVVLATHADLSYQMIQDKSDQEEKLLSVWSYQKNKAILHQDDSFIPSNPRARASWNYRRELKNDYQTAVSLTYDMNRLQSLTTQGKYFVTLNTTQSIDDDKVIREILYHHPIYTKESLESQKDLDQLNGKNRIFFCGSYFFNGFHEDAVNSALQVASHFDINL